MQAALQSAITQEFETPAWEVAQGGLDGDIACLTGNGECPAGDPASMILVNATAEDLAAAKEILTSTVLPDWAERAGPEWAQRWNETVGQTVGVQIGG